jgi:hypothetical protein
VSAVETTTPRAACTVGEPMVETMLFLGMNRPGGTVSEEEFQRFVAAEVTPRWREGYTILSGEGLWYSEQRQASERESSRVLIRLHDGSQAASAGIEQIRWAYVRNFAQDAVLRIDHPACADF